MKILVACEESQAVTIELRRLWHEAYSCDILPCSWGHPERHIQGDAIVEAYSGKYDMMIAHPPCTYLSNAWARHLFPKWLLNNDRYKKWLEAKEFFMKLYTAPIPIVVIENPIPSKIYQLPIYNQTIQPYEYWHPFKKKTCLWIKWVKKLEPNNIVPVSESTKVAGNWFNKGWKERQRNRSKTFPWIAKAIAEQRAWQA